MRSTILFPTDDTTGVPAQPRAGRHDTSAEGDDQHVAGSTWGSRRRSGLASHGAPHCSSRPARPAQDIGAACDIGAARDDPRRLALDRRLGQPGRRWLLTLKDRSRDVIISGGTNIYPCEVEEVLLRHGAVREVSVIGHADPCWDEARVACVVVDDASVGAQELDDFCRQNLTGFNRPTAYHFLQSLPRNSNSKVLKTHLRTTEAPTQIPVVAPRSPATAEERT